MPEHPRTLRRIVKAKGGGQAFRIATVKRDPFKQEYIDLCNSSFDEAISSAGSFYDQVRARGQHALERSEIIKAQSVALGKMVSGALRSNTRAPMDKDDEHDKDVDRGAVKPAYSAIDQDEFLRRYRQALAGSPEPLPLKEILGGLLFAESWDDDDRSSGSSDSGPINIADRVRLQTIPSSKLLMREPDALAAVLDLAESEPSPSTSGDATRSFPPNREVLAMIGVAEEEMLSSEDEMQPSEDESDNLSTSHQELAIESAPAEYDLCAAAISTELDAPQDQLAIASGSTASFIIDSGTADVSDEHDSLHTRGVDVLGASRGPSAIHTAALSECMTTVVDATVTKPARPKKAAPRQAKYGRLLIDLHRPAPTIGPSPKTARKLYAPRRPSDLSAALTTPWAQRQETTCLCASPANPQHPALHRYLFMLAVCALLSARSVLQVCRDLNHIMPHNRPEDPTLGEAQLERLFSHFLTRPPRLRSARFDRQSNVYEFLRDMSCCKMDYWFELFVACKPIGVLPFSLHQDNDHNIAADDDNPLQLVDEDEGAAFALHEQDDPTISPSHSFGHGDSPTTEQPVLGSSQLHDSMQTSSTSSHRHRSRPFGTASEYLRMKRKHNEEQRALAQRLSVRQLSNFLGKKMQYLPYGGYADGRRDTHCVNLNNIQFKQSSDQQPLPGARLFVAALQWAHNTNVHSQSRSRGDDSMFAAVRPHPRPLLNAKEPPSAK